MERALFLHVARSFLRSRSGNFAVITGIVLIPLIGAIGLAVDYARISHAKSVLTGAADAAASAAVSVASPTYKNGGSFNGNWTVEQAQKDALNLFEANIVNNVGFKINGVKAEFAKNGSSIDVKVSYSVSVPLLFMPIFNQHSYILSDPATSSVHTAPYLDFHLLLDNSPSMGLGATPADITALISATKPYEAKRVNNKNAQGCAFACHDISAEGSYGKNYVKLAWEKGITLRIDVLRDAAVNLFQKAQDPAIFKHEQQFRMGLYSFGKKAESTKLTEVSKLSSNLKLGEDKASTLELMSIPYQGFDNDQQTRFDAIFSDMNSLIGTGSIGTGDSETSRRQIVFFVSDGVADQPKSACTKPKTGNRCQEPIDPKICEPLKKRGISIAVLYTTYQPVDEGWYNKWIKPFQPEIATRMKECASPGMFFEVSPSQGIKEAMEALFIKVVTSPRITS